MSRELLIMRHAKSDWNTGIAKDFDRPLNKRGNASAPKMGQWLREQNLTPDWLISSPAMRTRQTASLVCAQLGIESEKVYWEQRIYEASLPDLLGILAECPDVANCILMIGHNPGMELLLLHLCPNVPAQTDGKLMPTAALARIRLPNDWSYLRAGCGELLALQKPRELDTEK